MQEEKVWIDKSGMRNNPYRSIKVLDVNFEAGQILDPAFKEYYDEIGFQEISIYVKPDNYSDIFYYRNERDTYPYIEYTAKPLEQIKQYQLSQTLERRKARYINESDPLMYDWLQGKIDKQIWIDKIAQIKYEEPK
jgi:hypothetical protein